MNASQIILANDNPKTMKRNKSKKNQDQAKCHKTKPNKSKATGPNTDNEEQIKTEKNENLKTEQDLLTKYALAYRRLDRLYSCRDLEISNLWQRSIFLSGLLLLIYTGYGVLIFNTFDVKNYNDIIVINIPSNILAIGVCTIGFIFSRLWIKMAKGSKAWYEVYESHISKLDGIISEQEDLDNPIEYISEYKASYYSMGRMNIDVDNRLFNTNAGAYSPSKINIILGQYSLILWSLTGVMHITFLTIGLFNLELPGYWLFGISVAVISVIVISVIAAVIKPRNYCKRRRLRKVIFKENKVKKTHIKKIKAIITSEKLRPHYEKVVKLYNNINQKSIEKEKDKRKKIIDKDLKGLKGMNKEKEGSFQKVVKELFDKEFAKELQSIRKQDEKLFNDAWDEFIYIFCEDVINAHKSSFMSIKSGFLGQ